MKKFIKINLILLFVSIVYSPFAHSHCQMPCGIFDDNARVRMMLEDVVTIKKSVNLIVQLSKKTDAQSNNQMVRWVITKEEHAQKIISTISNYFLVQRVKPDQKNYVERLKKHHAVMVAAMKVKQNVDAKYVDALEASINKLMPYYPEHKH